MTYGWSPICPHQSPAELCGNVASDMTTDLQEGSSPSSTGLKVANCRSGEACLCPTQVTGALAELCTPPASTAAKRAGVHGKVATDPRFILPSQLPGWVSDNESSVAGRVQAPFSLDSGAWLCCLWAPKSEKNYRSQKNATVEAGQTSSQKESVDNDAVASWKTVARSGLGTCNVRGCREPCAQTGAVRSGGHARPGAGLLRQVLPRAHSSTGVPSTTLGIPSVSSSSVLESHESRELPLHMGRGLCFIRTMFPW